jgi:hypothetical protein
MIPFKARITETTPGEVMTFKGNVPSSWAVTVQAVFYSSNNPGNFLHLYDGDGDEFMFAIPGQGQPRVATPEVQITVKLPIRCRDISQGSHEVIIWGRAEKVDSRL